ncbi:MAG: hypothetical protein NTX01_05790 [Candidatus Omnitrophica bacterium]|nr:hypothetical protein [Candidatus Omnitrophota bacterium]
MRNNSLRLAMVLLVVMLSCSAVAEAEATQSDTVAVKVTVTSTLSVNITEDTLALGSVAAGSTKVSTAAVTVTNNSSGINETYSLSLANPSGWTASQAAAGAETYVLDAVFDADGTGITWSEANYALSTTAVASSATKFAGDQTGVSVPYNAARKLWFQFKAPTATTVSTEQSIVVMVTAQAG